jgi:predicted DNA-binding transcriptional regulator AlpA
MKDKRELGNAEPSSWGQVSESLDARAGVVLTKLAELPERAFIDEKALAQALGVTKRTVRRMVGRYELPPPVSFAGRSMWQVRKVLTWFETQADRLARDAQRSANRLKEIL